MTDLIRMARHVPRFDTLNRLDERALRHFGFTRDELAEFRQRRSRRG